MFGDNTETAPKPRRRWIPTTGDVTNAASQPLAIYHAMESPQLYWCPSNQTTDDCDTINPFTCPRRGLREGLPGQSRHGRPGEDLSPWGTLDQGGNVVEWTDTITAPPFGVKGKRVWRRLHGGIANAPVYQLWLSAVGLQPQDNAAFTATYPWLGIRVGVVGDLKLGKG